MELYSFGKTRIRTTRLGLGTAALGRPGYINLGHGEDYEGSRTIDQMKARAHKLMDHAYGLGIRYFDTARSYGRGEEFLGNWQKSATLQNVTIGSKWGYTYTANWQVTAEKHEVKEHSRMVLDRQWKETNQFLRPEIYQIHSATPDSGVLDNNAVLERLWELRESGTTIGLSLSGVNQSETLDKAMQIRNGSEGLFGSVQATWNILEISAGEQLAVAAENGVGVIIKEAVANGRLTSRNQDPEFKEKMNILNEISMNHETGLDAVAIAYILKQKWVSVVLSGASTIKQLDENCKALDIELTTREIQLLNGFAEAPEEYWKFRSNMTWN